MWGNLTLGGKQDRASVADSLPGKKKGPSGPFFLPGGK